MHSAVLGLVSQVDAVQMLGGGEGEGGRRSLSWQARAGLWLSAIQGSGHHRLLEGPSQSHSLEVPGAAKGPPSDQPCRRRPGAKHCAPPPAVVSSRASRSVLPLGRLLDWRGRGRAGGAKEGGLHGWATGSPQRAEPMHLIVLDGFGQGLHVDRLVQLVLVQQLNQEVQGALVHAQLRVQRPNLLVDVHAALVQGPGWGWEEASGRAQQSPRGGPGQGQGPPWSPSREVLTARICGAWLAGE